MARQVHVLRLADLFQPRQHPRNLVHLGGGQAPPFIIFEQALQATVPEIFNHATKLT